MNFLFTLVFGLPRFLVPKFLVYPGFWLIHNEVFGAAFAVVTAIKICTSSLECFFFIDDMTMLYYQCKALLYNSNSCLFRTNSPHTLLINDLSNSEANVLLC